MLSYILKYKNTSLGESNLINFTISMEENGEKQKLEEEEKRRERKVLSFWLIDSWVCYRVSIYITISV